MGTYLVRFVVSLLSLLGHLFVVHFNYIANKALIVEIGFKNRCPKIKQNTTNKMIIALRALKLIDLYKKAKVNQNIVKKYFICHCCLLISCIIAIILFLIMVITNKSIGQIIQGQLGFTVAVVLVSSAVHFVMNAQYSPSERKRRGIE